MKKKIMYQLALLFSEIKQYKTEVKLNQSIKYSLFVHISDDETNFAINLLFLFLCFQCLCELTPYSLTDISICLIDDSIVVVVVVGSGGGCDFGI